MRLTDLQIRQLKLPPEAKAKQKTFFDDTMKGFGVRVSVGGSKTFVLMYGKRRNLRTLGHYPDMSLADARIEAKKAMGEVATAGEEHPTRIGALSFAEVRRLFLRDSASRTKASTLGEYSRLLNKHFPFEKPISAVTRKEVSDVIAGLRDKPSSAQHAFIAIRTLMNWAVSHGHVQASPVPPLKFKAPSRSRILSDEELVKVWKKAEATGYPYGALVQLLILTGQRRGEIAGLRRSWVKDGAISFPGGFTKNKREHVVPLSPLAASIIKAIPGGTDLLFPARGHDDVPFSGWSKAKRAFDQGLGLAPYTLHDLRRTFSSQMAALGTPIHVTEKLLNHVSGTLSGVAGVYNRYSYAAEMRSAMEAYEAHVLKLAGASEQGT